MNHITLEITTFCQANCIVCVRDKIKFKLGCMSQDLFEKAIREASEYFRGGVEFIDLGGMGEPLLDAEIEDKLMWLKRNFPTIRVGVTTNAQLLTKKKDILCQYVDILKISNYGFTQKSFESIHRGSLRYEEVKRNIEEFLQIPKENRPRTIMSFLMLEENKGEENLWREYWESKCEELYIWKPHNWAGYFVSHTKQEHDKCRSCGRPGNDFTVRTNGDVSACCFDFNHELTIGNLEKSSFKEICEGERLKEIIKMHNEKTFFDHKNICQHCDQLYDRADALIYSSDQRFKVNQYTTARLQK